MLCLIVEIVQYLKPLPPLLYKSTFSLYTILFLLTSQKSIFLHYYFILLYLYYLLHTIPHIFCTHIFFVVVLLFSTATLLHFFVFVLHTFCIILFLSFMNKRTVFFLLFLFFIWYFFSFILVIIVHSYIYFFLFSWQNPERAKHFDHLARCKGIFLPFCFKVISDSFQIKQIINTYLFSNWYTYVFVLGRLLALI